MQQKEVLDNCKQIIPIIKTVLFCGRQVFALRGHYDFGLHSLFMSKNMNNSNENNISFNDGNFCALLRFRVDADDHMNWKTT